MSYWAEIFRLSYHTDFMQLLTFYEYFILKNNFQNIAHPLLCPTYMISLDRLVIIEENEEYIFLLFRETLDQVEKTGKRGTEDLRLGIFLTSFQICLRR